MTQALFFLHPLYDPKHKKVPPYHPFDEYRPVPLILLVIFSKTGGRFFSELSQQDLKPEQTGEEIDPECDQEDPTERNCPGICPVREDASSTMDAD